jgi:hypothetical protein
MRVVYCELTVLLLCSTVGGQMRSPAAEVRYTVAFASARSLQRGRLEETGLPVVSGVFSRASEVPRPRTLS